MINSNDNNLDFWSRNTLTCFLLQYQFNSIVGERNGTYDPVLKFLTIFVRENYTELYTHYRLQDKSIW